MTEDYTKIPSLRLIGFIEREALRLSNDYDANKRHERLLTIHRMTAELSVRIIESGERHIHLPTWKDAE